MNAAKLIVPAFIGLCILTYSLKGESLDETHLVGATDDPSYVGHGHITDVSNLSCYESELQDVDKYYLYSEGKLYDENVDREILSDYVYFSVSHNILNDDPTKMVTTISNSGKTQRELKEMGARVPVFLQCAPSVKTIYNLEKINSVAVTPVTDVCPHGEVVLPNEASVPIDLNNYVNYSVTRSDDDSIWIINSWQTYKGVESFGVDFEYIDLNSKTLNIPVELKCEMTPKKV